ncbi:unnamed protein product, partial [marine sediment metagenome]
ACFEAYNIVKKTVQSMRVAEEKRNLSNNS